MNRRKHGRPNWEFGERSLSNRWTTVSRLSGVLCAMLLLTSCGQTAKPVVAPAQGQVFSYFGSAMNPALQYSQTIMDHSANQISISTASTSSTPSPIISGTFTIADTGFLKITENFANGSPQNPPLSGAWAVEIEGAGALANVLQPTQTGLLAGPVSVVSNAACPTLSKTPFLYVGVPPTSAQYGAVTVNSQGSFVTFEASPFGQPAQSATGACSETYFGPVISYPINSFGNPINSDAIAIGASGLLVDNGVGTGNQVSALGTLSGALGVVMPSSPVNTPAVVSAKYNGFFYGPQNAANNSFASLGYDITTLASAYGDFSATSNACSVLQSSIMANQGQGAGTVSAPPSANSIYGGDFLSVTSTGVTVNDPTGAAGSENCDLIIDLGQQDSKNNGLFSSATIFIGANYPPFTASNVWHCNGLSQGNGNICAISFAASAVVGQVQGKYVIFVGSNMAQLPFGSGFLSSNQQIGIYLFEK